MTESRVLQKGKNRITQGYSVAHPAVDLGREHITGEPVIAHSSGVVVSCKSGARNNKGSTGTESYGNYVKIDHGNGYSTLYAHLKSITVKRGQNVVQGQVIGEMGNTGNSYGVHLHFEVRRNNVRVEPIRYLEADLPVEERVDVVYSAFCKKRWLPDVVNCNDKYTDGYAGITGTPIECIIAKPSKGTLRYRVHTLNGRWLPWVENDYDYAGNKGQPIDAIQMKLLDADGYDVSYRVSDASSAGWKKWCVGLKDPTGDGHAGTFGRPIDCIQIKIEKVK